MLYVYQGSAEALFLVITGPGLKGSHHVGTASHTELREESIGQSMRLPLKLLPGNDSHSSV